jgi:hypothetical protein
MSYDNIEYLFLKYHFQYFADLSILCPFYEKRFSEFKHSTK